MIRRMFLTALCLATSFTFAQSQKPLKLSSLSCKVVSAVYPNYPVGSTLTYDANSDEIDSKGFISNVKIRNPEIVTGMLGNMGIAGQSFAQGPIGEFAFDVELSIESPTIMGPVSLKDVKMRLLTETSKFTAGTPDADLACDIEVR